MKVNSKRIVSLLLLVALVLSICGPIFADVLGTAPTLTPSTLEPTKNNIVITINYPIGSLNKQYKIDNGDWLTYTSPITMNNNGVVYARGNITGAVGYLNILNIDNSNPVNIISAKPILDSYGNMGSELILTEWTNKDVNLNVENMDISNYIPITSAEELNNMRYNVENTFGVGTKWEGTYTGGLNKKYIQLADINLSVYVNWDPLGTFTGEYNGNGYKITNMNINRPTENYVGLFGTSSQASLNNITIENASVKGKNYVGNISGYSEYSIISNTKVSGTTTGYVAVGGLVGYSEGVTVLNSKSTANVEALSYYAGGILGYACVETNIFNSYNTGIIKGKSETGGLIGKIDNPNTTIVNSYSVADIIGLNNANSVGGLVGEALSGVTIKNSYAKGIITGSDYVGGLSGVQYGGEISNSFYEGTISIDNITSYSGYKLFIGGLVGYTANTSITNSNSNINIVLSPSTVENHYWIGGIVGYGSYNTNIKNVFSKGSIVAQIDTNGSGTYVSAIGGIVGFNENGNLEESSSQINITVTGTGKAYTGGLVGYAYSNITLNNTYSVGTITGTSYAGGLIGYSSKSNIYTSYSKGQITGTGDYVGGLVGYGITTIVDQSFYEGNVKGLRYTGGLMGYANGITVTDSYTKGKVDGTNRVGGLVGDGGSLSGDSSITNSHSTSNITGYQYVGGIVGYFADSIIERVYYIGTITGGSSIYHGGIVGGNYRTTIINSYAKPTINATGQHSGGIAGHNTGIIILSYAEGTINSTDQYVGGLVGYNNGTVERSYFKGTITSTGATVGGLVGNNNTGGTILNSYAQATLTGGNFVGGAVGSSSLELNNIYTVPIIKGTPAYKGGIVGFTSPVVNSSYYDSTISGLSDIKGSPRTTTQMRTTSTYVGWDFTNIWNTPTSTSYPTLKYDITKWNTDGTLKRNNTKWNTDGTLKIDITIWNTDGTLKRDTTIWNTDGSIKLDWDFVNTWINNGVNNPTLKEQVLKKELPDGVGEVKIINPDGTYTTYNLVIPRFINRTVSQNGTYTIVVTDKVGNVNLLNRRLNIDKIAPTITLKNSITKIDVVVGDALSGVDLVKGIELPDGTKLYNSNFSYNITSNGTYTFVAYDKAGNRGQTTIAINHFSPPEITFNHNGGTTPQKSHSTIVQVISILGIDSSEYQWTTSNTLPITGTWKKFVTGETLTQSTGTENYYLHIRATDNLGNVSTATSNFFRLDNTAPIITTNISPMGWANVNKIATASVNEGTLNTVSRTFTENGSVTFTATDQAGNTSSKEVVLVDIDKKPPNIAVTGDLITTKKNVLLTISATDTPSVVPNYGASGIKQIELPNGALVNASNTTFNITLNGTYSFKVEDVAGNETTETVTITNIDDSFPVISYNPNGNTIWGKSQQTIVTVVDNTGVDNSQYQWTQSSTFPTTGVWIAFNGSVTGETLTQPNGTGHYYLHIKAIDTVGNESIATSNLFNLDNEVPTLTINKTLVGSTYDITVTTSDSHSGINVIKGITLVEYTSPTGITEPKSIVITSETAIFNIGIDGTYKFRVEDKVGNITEGTVDIVGLNNPLEITIEKISPAISYPGTIYKVIGKGAIALGIKAKLQDNDIADIIEYKIELNDTGIENRRELVRLLGETEKIIHKQYLFKPTNSDGVYTVKITGWETTPPNLTPHNNVVRTERFILLRKNPPKPIIDITGTTAKIEYPTHPLESLIGSTNIYREYSIGGNPYINYTGNIDLTSIPSGTTIYARHRDMVGNYSLSIKTYINNSILINHIITPYINDIQVEETKKTTNYFIGIRHPKNQGILDLEIIKKFLGI